MSTLQPLNDNVIVLPIEEESKTQSGIILVDKKSDSRRGRVVHVGPGRVTKDGIIKTTVKEGDEILFPQFGYSAIAHEGVIYLNMPESNIIAVVKE